MNVLLVAVGIRGGPELEQLGAGLAARGAHVTQAPTFALADQMLAVERPDVVISLVDQAEGPGLEILRRLRKERPDVVTVAFTPSDAVRAAGVAVHIAERVVTNETSVASMLRVLEDAVMVRSILGDDRMDRLLHAGGDLAAPPAMAFEVARLAADGDLDGVSEALEREPVLTGRVLQAANAPFFGIPRQVVSAREAALYLGLEQVSALVVGEAVSHVAAEGLPESVTRTVTIRGLSAAGVIRALSLTIDIPKWLTSVAFTAAMLRDIGALVMYRAAVAGGGPAPKIEQLLADRHAEGDDDGPDVSAVGAYLLSSWQIPDLVVSAVASHTQRPGVHPGDLVGPNELTWLASEYSARGVDILSDEQDRVALAALGLEDAVSRIHPSAG